MTDALQPSADDTIQGHVETVGPEINEATLKQDLEFLLCHLGPMTLLALVPDLGLITGHWTREADDATLQWITKLNQTGRNIYFSLNQPLPGLNKKASKAEIVSYRATCADSDAKNGRSMADCLAAIEQLPLPPSFIIMTGGGYQPVWLIEPLPASPNAQQHLEAIGRTIGDRTGSDRVENVDRILRLPGTINHPNARKRAAGRTRCMASLLEPAVQ
jgi:hypothetical protein